MKGSILYISILFICWMVTFVSFSQKSVFVPASNPYLAKWVLIRGSSLKVSGSTNINKFTCDISDYSGPDTILVYKNNSNEFLFPLKGAIRLDVKSFDCHNAMMTSDLCKTLKSKEFPKLTIHFISLSKMPDFKSSGENISGLVNIEVAGVSKNYFVNYSFSKENNTGIIHLIGRRPVNFSDFNLSPPKKLGGMIRTREELLVEFNITMKSIQL